MFNDKEENETLTKKLDSLFLGKKMLHFCVGITDHKQLPRMLLRVQRVNPGTTTRVARAPRARWASTRRPSTRRAAAPARRASPRPARAPLPSAPAVSRPFALSCDSLDMRLVCSTVVAEDLLLWNASSMYPGESPPCDSRGKSYSHSFRLAAVCAAGYRTVSTSTTPVTCEACAKGSYQAQTAQTK